MGLTTADLKESKWTEQDKKEIAIVLDNYKQNDKWANKTFKKIGILITSHPGNRTYLKACIETHKKLGYWICLAYDNYIHPKEKDVDYNNIMPSKYVMDNIDTFLIPHYQTWGGVLYPWFWLMKFGVNAMREFEYLYCINGDFILEKPEGFSKLFSLLGDADIMTYGPNSDNSMSTCFIAKTDSLIKIMKHIQDHFIPFENYEKYTQEYGNAEGRFAKAVKELNLTYIDVEPPYNEQMHIKGYGTWYDLVGFRHIHGELNYAYRNKGIPPELKYLDERYIGSHDKKYIKLYEETKDKNVLKSWWPSV